MMLCTLWDDRYQNAATNRSSASREFHGGVVRIWLPNLPVIAVQSKDNPFKLWINASTFAFHYNRTAGSKSKSIFIEAKIYWLNKTWAKLGCDWLQHFDIGHLLKYKASFLWSAKKTFELAIPYKKSSVTKMKIKNANACKDLPSK